MDQLWSDCRSDLTLSGVGIESQIFFSGMDMAISFIEHLVGKKITEHIRGIVELSERKEDDDEFAEMYGLL